jgi:hypothetical protein
MVLVIEHVGKKRESKRKQIDVLRGERIAIRILKVASER